MTMFITTLLLYIFARERWGWSPLKGGLVCGGFLVIDLAFLGANLVKIPDGGWFPLVVGGLVFLIVTTWHTGRRLVGRRLRQGELPLERFIQSVSREPTTRVPGTAVFMYSRPGATPPALLANVRHNQVLHERTVILSVRTAETPRVAPAERETIVDHGEGFFSVRLQYGFMEEPDVPRALQAMLSPKVSFDPLLTRYFIGKESVVPEPGEGMAVWRERLFAVMHRNATGAGTFFNLPDDRTVELGQRVGI
jgi:KUP system potassium uptake protein